MVMILLWITILFLTLSIDIIWKKTNKIQDLEQLKSMILGNGIISTLLILMILLEYFKNKYLSLTLAPAYLLVLFIFIVTWSVYGGLFWFNHLLQIKGKGAKFISFKNGVTISIISIFFIGFPILFCWLSYIYNISIFNLPSN